MELYIVYMTTELGEEVDVCVQASSSSEAEAIGMTMLEGGELQCMELCVCNVPRF